MNAKQESPSATNGEVTKRLLSRAAAAESMVPQVGGETTDAGRTFAKDAELFRSAAALISNLAKAYVAEREVLLEVRASREIGERHSNPTAQPAEYARSVQGNSAESLYAAPLSLEHDMARILQIACDADEAPAKELLNQIAEIASKHPWPQSTPSETAIPEHVRQFLAEIEEPRLGIHDDGTEEMKSWEHLWNNLQEAAKWIRNYAQAAPSATRRVAPEDMGNGEIYRDGPHTRPDDKHEQSNLPSALRSKAKLLPDNDYVARGLMNMAADRLDTLEARLSATRSNVAEECAKICEARAVAWDASVREGSEQRGYEETVLMECAAAIRREYVHSSEAKS